MDLSIIVPAYNEERRIKGFLAALSSFCKKHLKNYEILVVDDGSKDGTLAVTKDFAKKDKSIRVITYPKNGGKGFAVQKGVFAAKGDFILFIDADGSTMPDEIPAMLKEAKKADCVVGNRRDKRSVVITSKYRKLTQLVFNFCVMALFRSKVNDNLCGFKGFKKAVARDIFKELHDYGWIFDVELFYKIRKRGYTLARIPIKWKHVGDSKIKPLDPMWMFFKLIKLRWLTLFERKW